MAEPLTTSAAVQAALLRPLTANETSFIDGLIAQASSKLRIALPKVDERIDGFSADPPPANALDPDAVSAVLAGVIKRYMVNVSGAASETRAVGPYSQSTSFASGGKALGGGGELKVTADDVAELVPLPNRSIGSIRVRAALAPRELHRRW